jgi:Phosphate-induced protein 1 conserved region
VFQLFKNLDAYIIWYGTWTTAAQNPILNFVSSVGATPWWAINKPYGVGSLVYKKAVADNYSQGKTLTTSTVWASVYNAINKGLLPLDTNAIYLVLSSR